MTQSIAAPGLAERVSSDDQASEATAVPVYLPAQRALASPDMLNPFRWSAVMDFGPVYQLAEIDTRGGTLGMGETTYPKPGRSAAVLAAERSKLGRVYMDWSPMPFVELNRPDKVFASTPESGSDPVANIITFRDPRFMGGWSTDHGRAPLEGIVKLDAQNHVVEQSMDGRVEP